jgi:hypothetical protein
MIMNKRVFTSYTKLNKAAKMAVQRAYPDGVDDILTTMKNVFSGKMFKGFVFDHEDVTYMVEWNTNHSFATPDFSDVEMEMDVEVSSDEESFELEEEDDY